MKRSLASALSASLALGALALGGCVDEGRLPSGSKHWVAISQETTGIMLEKGMTKSDPILLRSYKKESELEVWKRGRDGKYQLLKIYPMCRWSGQLGPKVREGDRQVPEGFYAISPSQMNPNSNYYLSVNVGYPNAFDRAHDRTGALIMIHGACSSAGCLSMTDEQVADLYAVMREAFNGGQQSIQFQSFPFRMTAQNLAKFRADQNMPFWKNLKEGADHFDVTRQEPKVSVCARKYVFNATAKSGSFNAAAACPPMETDPALAQAVNEKAHADEVKVAELVGAGTPAVKRIYKDGDQHPAFKGTVLAHVDDGSSGPARVVATPVSKVQEVSRPDALAEGPVEVPVGDLKNGKFSPAGLAASKTPPAGKLQPAETVVAAASPAPVAAPAPSPTPVPAAASSGFGMGFLGRFVGTAEPEAVAAPTLGTPANVPLPPSRHGLPGKQARAAIAGVAEN